MKNVLKIFGLVGILIFASCGDKNKKSEPQVIEIETTIDDEVYESGEIVVTFKEDAIASIFKQYIHLKTAFVNSDAELAANEAEKLKVELLAVHIDEDLSAAVQQIIESTDIETQRKAFVAITESIEVLLDGAIQSGTVYKQYCPMAFGNTGAFWLSESKYINNPYFGDRMLKCGRIDSELK